MKLIPLTQDKYAMVDDVDFENVNQFKWYYSNGYARTDFNYAFQRINLSIHQLVLGMKDGFLPDHKDGNRLNNQRYNLRFSTEMENSLNRRARLGMTSKYKGVCKDHERGGWIMQIKVNRKRVSFGRFDKEIDAALAYDAKAREFHGEFAVLNFK